MAFTFIWCLTIIKFVSMNHNCYIFYFVSCQHFFVQTFSELELVQLLCVCSINNSYLAISLHDCCSLDSFFLLIILMRLWHKQLGLLLLTFFQQLCQLLPMFYFGSSLNEVDDSFFLNRHTWHVHTNIEMSKNFYLNKLSFLFRVSIIWLYMKFEEV